ncbi:MAG: hypothetical protein WKF71_17725 [Pyrinomonadaceae bacterium]
MNEIKSFCETKNLSSRINLKLPKRERKTRTKRDARGQDTYSITLDMFKSGLSIEEIAEVARDGDQHD